MIQYSLLGRTAASTCLNTSFRGLAPSPKFCLRMGTELVPETLYSNELTRLCAREDYIASVCLFVCLVEAMFILKYSDKCKRNYVLNTTLTTFMCISIDHTVHEFLICDTLINNIWVVAHWPKAFIVIDRNTIIATAVIQCNGYGQ
jgi:hypothetical protein